MLEFDQVAEDMFYAAQSAYSYRGLPIVQWEDVPDQVRDAFIAGAQALQALPAASRLQQAQALVAPLSEAVPGGISKSWRSMDGRSRANLVFIAEAFARAVAPTGDIPPAKWDELNAQPKPSRNRAKQETTNGA